MPRLQAQTARSSTPPSPTLCPSNLAHNGHLQGSVCAYIASCLEKSGISTGRFNSPHLVDRWDCINLNGAAVPRDIFLAAESAVKATDKRLSIGATEFELLTATAFEIFSKTNVEVGVIEVGLGGRLDATNIIEDPLVTVLSKIGLDHQGILGSTIEDIAREKAGIMKKGSVCVVDASNDSCVLEVVKSVAKDVGAGGVALASPVRTERGACEITTSEFGVQQFASFLSGGYQPNNLACAVNALSIVASKFPSITATTVQAGVAATRWPGRLEWLEVPLDTGETCCVLVDGAHNPQAARELAKYVDENMRGNTASISWILAASKGKNVDEILQILVQPCDEVISTEFGPVDGMPWVQPTTMGDIAELASRHVGSGGSAITSRGVLSAVQKACMGRNSHNRNIVVAGSLYATLLLTYPVLITTQVPGR